MCGLASFGEIEIGYSSRWGLGMNLGPYQPPLSREINRLWESFWSSRASNTLVQSPRERLHPFGRLDIMWEIHKCIKRAQPELFTTSSMPRACSMCVFDSYLINGKELALTHISPADLTLFFGTFGHFLYFCDLPGCTGVLQEDFEKLLSPFLKKSRFISLWGWR